jgi:hypothetical protein
MPIINNKLLAGVFGEFLRNNAPGDVIGAARWPCDDDPHRLCGVGLRHHTERRGRSQRAENGLCELAHDFLLETMVF